MYVDILSLNIHLRMICFIADMVEISVFDMFSIRPNLI